MFMPRLMLCALSSALLLGLGACGKRDAEPASPPAAEVPAAPPAEPPAAPPAEPAEPAERASHEVPDDFPLRPMDGGEVHLVQRGGDGQRRATSVILLYPIGAEDALSEHVAAEFERLGIEPTRVDQGEGAERNISFAASSSDPAASYGALINRRGEHVGVTLTWTRAK
jgi:hypothetical protein